MVRFRDGVWVGKVVNRKDDVTQSGKVQVRIYGIYDDESNIPDSDLPWVYVGQTPTHAMVAGVGSSPVGLIEGSVVQGEWLDNEMSIGVVKRVLHRSSLDPDTNTPDNDVFQNAKGTDYNPVIKASVTVKAASTAKYPTKATVANQATGPKAPSLILQVDPGNLSGVLKQAPQAVQQALQVMGASSLSKMAGGGGLQSLVTQLVSSIVKEVSTGIPHPPGDVQCVAAKALGPSITSAISAIKALGGVNPAAIEKQLTSALTSAAMKASMSVLNSFLSSGGVGGSLTSQVSKITQLATSLTQVKGSSSC